MTKPKRKKVFEGYTHKVVRHTRWSSTNELNIPTVIQKTWCEAKARYEKDIVKVRITLEEL